MPGQEHDGFYRCSVQRILTISDNSDLEKNFKKILFDADFRKELTNNADAFVEKFMSYRGNASEKFASILKLF